MAEENDAYAAMVNRLGRWIALVGAVSIVGVAIQFGWRNAVGFGFGAAGAFLNMRWLAKGLLTPAGPAARLLVLRFALLAGAAYVILETFRISPLAILAGLLTASVAVILEILFQLFYART